MISVILSEAISMTTRIKLISMREAIILTIRIVMKNIVGFAIKTGFKIKNIDDVENPNVRSDCNNNEIINITINILSIDYIDNVYNNIIIDRYNKEH